MKTPDESNAKERKPNKSRYPDPLEISPINPLDFRWENGKAYMIRAGGKTLLRHKKQYVRKERESELVSFDNHPLAGRQRKE